ncbi:hypothetical protein PC128_g2981 [Phytophthora cactorum]|nr:hypothetical protein PC120_g5884 [Phytophthora cactorum]KAG3202702.1 hypothetical protein PC128_g2981 [Phytophthora cactorum]
MWGKGGRKRKEENATERPQGNQRTARSTQSPRSPHSVTGGQSLLECVPFLSALFDVDDRPDFALGGCCKL